MRRSFVPPCAIKTNHSVCTLMLLANVNGGINSLMAEVLEDHIRQHLLLPERKSANPHELAEDMIELVRTLTSS
jgi:DNA-binding FrmR family transcriptional regulator